MKIDIGVIISPPLEEIYQTVAQRLKGVCNIHIYVVHRNEEIVTHFINAYPTMNAFVFSGPTLHQYLLKHHSSFEKPCYVIFEDLANIYRELLKIFMNNPGLSSDRVYIDYFTLDNAAAYEGLFPAERHPFVSPWRSDEMYGAGEMVLARHLELWEQGKIDLAITKYGLTVDELREAGVPYHYVTPSPDYLVETIQSIIREHKMKRIRINRMAIIQIAPCESAISPMDPIERDIRLLSLQKELLAVMRRKNYDFILQKENGRLSILSTIDELLTLTDEFRSCGIHRMLEGAIEFPFVVGYGSGKNILQAQANASEALLKAQTSQSLCYYLGEDQINIGPLLIDEVDQEVSEDPSVQNLALQIGIQDRYLQKIICHTRKNKSNLITGQDISEILQITARSGNRILNQMVDKQFAVASQDKKSSQRGRPSKQYELLFLQNNGQVK